MRSRFLLAAIALCGALAGAGAASAQSLAYAVPYGTTNMRAGPGLDYPVVAIIRGGSAVTVYGCLPDFGWCDSSVEDIRGWVSTTRLEFEYGGNLVPIPRYYSYFEAPIIRFDFGYWDRYYRDRPFYRDRDRHGDRPRWRNRNNDVGIFPEEGGGRHRRDQGRPPRFSDQGGGVIEIPPEEGGGRNRNRRPPVEQGGGVGVFPEEGGGGGGDGQRRRRSGGGGVGVSPEEGGGGGDGQRRRRSGGGSGQQGGDAVCPVDSPNCQ